MSETHLTQDDLRSPIQSSLGKQYRRSPEFAATTDHASTRAANHPSSGTLDPLHTWVKPGAGHDITLPVGLHPAAGGLGDLPVPGDLLCAALDACTDSTIRVVANALGVELLALAVNVSAEVDVRGTLRVTKDVPVAFQTMRVQIQLRSAADKTADRLHRLIATTEQCCVVLQTLRDGVSVEVDCYHSATL